MPATWFPHGVSPPPDRDPAYPRQPGIRGVKGYPTATQDSAETQPSTGNVYEYLGVKFTIGPDGVFIPVSKAK